MKKILIISDYFPPIGNIASLRSGYVSKAFQERGWAVYVVCRQLENFHYVDSSIDGLPPASCIHRLNVKTERSNKLINKLINLFQKIFQPELYRQKKHLYTQYLRKACQLIENYDIGVIYTSSGPEATVLIGYNLKKKYNTKWIADLRDLPEMNKFEKLSDKLYNKSLLCSQTKLLRSANLLITVSVPLARMLKDRTNRDVEVILNGFDRDLHSKVINSTDAGKFIIVYTGQIHGLQYQDPREVFRAIDELITSGNVDKELLRIEFYGASLELVNSMSVGFMCRGNIYTFNHCSLSQSIRHQHRANLLLLLTVKGQKGIYTTKLFDYLASKRPIIAYPNDRDVVNEIILKYNAGICTDSREEIKDFIMSIYNDWLNGTISGRLYDDYALNQLSRQFQCNKLVSLAEALT